MAGLPDLPVLGELRCLWHRRERALGLASPTAKPASSRGLMRLNLHEQSRPLSTLGRDYRLRTLELPAPEANRLPCRILHALLGHGHLSASRRGIEIERVEFLLVRRGDG